VLHFNKAKRGMKKIIIIALYIFGLPLIYAIIGTIFDRPHDYSFLGRFIFGVTITTFAFIVISLYSKEK
jgi:hypothetical protein